MARARPDSEQLIDRDQSDVLIARVGRDSGVEARHGRYELTPPATVFAHLTDAERMMTWLAQDVKVGPPPGGIFRLADLSGFWVEGACLEVIPHRMVGFTWGGIESLKPGQSTVEFTLHPDGNSTTVRLRHFGLFDPAVEAHRRGWKILGLPKLKGVAEGRESGGICLGEAAGLREQHPYLARVACEN
jgi:uncharacterized protein YndB with AHSA1/START domain